MRVVLYAPANPRWQNATGDGKARNKYGQTAELRTGTTSLVDGGVGCNAEDGSSTLAL